ncbi:MULTISPECIES: phosphate acyltransferase PlsX [unclassified Ruminococcus]|uniref:phosphate acyltransferase PlsX n=1 Tax=unclassified Ruminococcus TaxID=2608920 RepID=UPI00210CF5A0|nr:MULTISPECIES: phosphate acyltransferase PlsX [unclassified Ruminococcus]MCQ4021631.1 phosphate acyltransferase PlsX [Ruminococcus sp. zg-924]MCQ4114076.1 phosphate acyltransferase PlsX [Ruminococcus sp. zg-921]
MKIIIDAFGGDNAPLEIIKGARMAKDEYGVDILLTGSERKIRLVATQNDIKIDDMQIVNADEVITMEDDPSAVIKTKKNSSMALGFELLAKGEGDAFISAGNSGALVMGATMIIKRIKGVKRPAFAPVLPTLSGCSMLIDGGANVECRPEMLTQFAVMGSIYMNKVIGIDNPTIGLANCGSEEHKGTALYQEAYQQLKASNLNFIGNVEGRGVPEGESDVVVADGFTGNIILKMYEGVAGALMGMIKGILTKNLKNKLAAAMVLSDMKKMKKQFDYNEYGGSPILGVTKPVFKAHGSSKARTIKSAVGLIVEFVKNNVVNEIAANINL